MELQLNIDITNSTISSSIDSDAARDNTATPARYICDPAKTIMIYGFDHCHMWDVLALFKNNSMIERVYDYIIGSHTIIDEKDPCFYSPSGEPLSQLDEKSKSDSLKQECKNALNRMVADNYKRREKDANAIITPILFCIDTNNNSYPITPESFCFGKQTTYSELRRAYKLCTDLKVDPKIRSIACETFRFSYVNTAHNFELSNHSYEVTQKYQISPIPAPWEAKEIKTAWEQKQLTKQGICQTNKPYDWRKDLNQFVDRLLRTDQNVFEQTF